MINQFIQAEYQNQFRADIIDDFKLENISNAAKGWVISHDETEVTVS